MRNLVAIGVAIDCWLKIDSVGEFRIEINCNMLIVFDKLESCATTSDKNWQLCRSLLIRRSLVRAQVEEPKNPSKTSLYEKSWGLFYCSQRFIAGASCVLWFCLGSVVSLLNMDLHENTPRQSLFTVVAGGLESGRRCQFADVFAGLCRGRCC